MSVGIETSTSRGCWIATLGLVLGACGSDGERPPAWEPEVADDGAGESSTGAGEEGPMDPGEGDDTSGGSACVPGQVSDCLCVDGSTAQQTCAPDGSGFGECECGDGGSGGEGSGTTGDEPPPDENVVCYPGQNNDFSTCLPIHPFAPLPDGYDYPPPYQGDPNYRAPVALLDLEEVDPGTYVAPNFQLGELAQLDKGRYAVVQVHAVVSLQELRDQVGGINVNSGYRSPAYNAGIPGSATNSRHMFGDGFDLDPLEVGLGTLESACVGIGGVLVEYTTHVHCDFRNDPVDEEFYGPVPQVTDPEPPQYEADLVLGDDGIWRAPAEGFDEGEPQRRWTARDAAGHVIGTFVGAELVPPPGTATVEVRVGAQVERTAAVP